MVRKLESYLDEKAKREADDRCLVSRSEERREKQRLETERFEFATRLTELKQRHLDRLELPAHLLEVIDEIHVIESPPARTRALKRLRAELRDVDLELLAKGLAALSSPAAPQTENAQSQWLAKLVAGGDPVLTDFVQQFPHVDRAQLRTLIRTYVRSEGRERERTSRRLLVLLQQTIKPAPRSGSPAARDAEDGAEV
jgi:ribosome-associated protein